MEKPAFLRVDAPEELPIAVQVRMQDPIGRLRREALEALAQLARAKHGEHHDLIEIGALALDAGLFPHDRVTAVAADHIIPFEHRMRAAAGLMLDRDPHAGLVLLDRPRRPSETGLDQGEGRELPAQDILQQILRHAVVLLKIEFIDGFAIREGVPVLAHEALVGGHTAYRNFRRQHALGAQFLDAAPEVETLERALREVLSLGNFVHPDTALHQRAGYATQTEIDREPDADGTAADDDDLTSLPQGGFSRRGARPVQRMPVEQAQRVPHPAFS
jgi:hypothetical protein